MNDTLLPNKMTKSYLLESDPYLKTSSKTSPFALNGDDGVYRVANVWNGHHSSAIPSEVISDRPTVKPLAMHNVPSNVPPIAYINGNSVRPVRCRHYSQQQTVFHAATAAAATTNNNNNNSDSEKNSGIKVAAGDMHHYAKPDENGVNDNGGAGDNVARRDSAGNGSAAAAPMTPQPAGEVRDQSPASSQQQGVESPAYQSPSSLRDFETNNENESSIYNLYENGDQVIQHLAKRIEDALRLAKESRQLVCNELLVPQLLTAHAAADVIEMAECEPGGLRGCQLFICIEDSGANSALNQSRPRNKKPSLDFSQQQQELLNSKLHSRRLGEVKFDRSVVPTFEVYLTLKRAAPNWFESLENKLLGKERVVLSELYLLHKKQLYLEPAM